MFARQHLLGLEMKNCLKKIFSLFLFIFIVIPFNSHAGVVEGCTGSGNNLKAKVVTFFIEGDWSDAAPYSNRLLLKLTNQDGVSFSCNGKNYVYIENSSGAYSSMVSLVYLVYSTNRYLDIVINPDMTSGDASQIAYLQPIE